MNRLKQALSIFLASWISLVTLPGMAFAQDETTSPPPVVSAQPSQQELQQLVAPIALYPDSLVAQILAASTYPDQVVEADRWLQAHPGLKGDQLAQAVDQQQWDPSVKAMTEFPSVLANMDKNLSWTSSLGDAYINNQDAVMNAIQEMRHDAQKAGNLNSTSQVTVQDQGPDIVIEPANPEIVYVPEYDPWMVYGVGIAPWPGWYWYPGLYWTGPGIGFGLGFGIGFFGGYGWGWHHWGSDWHHHDVRFDHGAWESHGRAFENRGYYADRSHGGDGFHGGGFHGAQGFHGGGGFHGAQGFHGGDGFHGGGGGFHGGAPAHSFSNGGHSGAFGGFNHGGVAGGYSARGSASIGGSHGGFGGGGFHGGGGGGFHGGGGGGFHGGGGGGHR